jgi:hypothetical protein
MAHPEAYIPAAATLFDENGQLNNAQPRQFMAEFLSSFEAWINLCRAA